MKLGLLALVSFATSVFGCSGKNHFLVEELVTRFDASACQDATLLSGGGREGKNGHVAFREYSADKECADQLIAEMDQLGFSRIDEKTFARTPETVTSEQLRIEARPLTLDYDVEWLEWGYEE
ncbi:MAG: hypothetical protein AAF697_00315 [Pseudomonadota bacterium]